MKFVSYSLDDRDPSIGVVDGDDVHGAGPDVATTLQQLIASGRDLNTVGQQILDRPATTLPLSEVDLHAPVTAPASFRDFMAFEGHVVNCYKHLGTEVNPLWYRQPVFYFSNPHSILGPKDAVPRPPGSTMLDFELEIGAVIGTEGRDLTPDVAESHVAGYVVLCDWTARDLQMQEVPVGLGPVKGKDSATTLGAYLVTPDELDDRRRGAGYDLAATVSVNGDVVGRGNWADAFWSFGDMIAYASRGTRVVPGDLIGSGTISTCCLFEHVGIDPNADWLHTGDIVTLSVERLGTVDAVIGTGPNVQPIPPPPHAPTGT